MPELVDLISINGVRLSRPEAYNSPRGQALLEAARAETHEVKCACRSDADAPGLYIRRHGAKLVVARMPDTGLTHAPDCICHGETQHSETAGERDSTIQEVDGKTMVQVDIPLAIARKDPIQARTRKAHAGGRRNAAPPKPPGLSAIGLLTFLWDATGLNRWSPKMEGKRGWHTVAYHIAERAKHIEVAGRPLSDRLYVPPPFRPHGDTAAAAGESIQDFARRGSYPGSNEIFFVVGEIRALEAADRGEQKLFLKHMRDTFFVHGDVWRTMAETQASVQKLVSAADGARVVAMLAVTVSKSSWLRVAYGAFLATTKHYVPFATPQEFALQSRLSAEERRFVRILHFMPGTENTEDLLLTDTGKPVTMVIVGATSNERMETARIAKIDDMKRTGGAVWEWNAILGGIPTLPALSRPHLERSAVG